MGNTIMPVFESEHVAEKNDPSKDRQAKELRDDQRRQEDDRGDQKKGSEERRIRNVVRGDDTISVTGTSCVTTSPTSRRS